MERLWESALLDPDKIPPLFGPGDFSRQTLTETRRRAVGLLESGLLLVDEEFCVNDIIERCDQLLREGYP